MSILYPKHTVFWLDSMRHVGITRAKHARKCPTEVWIINITGAPLFWASIQFAKVYFQQQYALTFEDYLRDYIFVKRNACM